MSTQDNRHSDDPRGIQPTDGMSETYASETYENPFESVREGPVEAPNRDYKIGVEPEFRCYPMHSWAPSIDIDHLGVGQSLVAYIGQEMLKPVHIEYRLDDASAWLDAANPGSPAPRGTPQLSERQTRRLVGDRQDLADVPYGEPLPFLACKASDMFWERAVAAGWVPSDRALALMVRARQLIDTAPFEDFDGLVQQLVGNNTDEDSDETDFDDGPRQLEEIQASEQEFFERVSYERAVFFTYKEAKPGSPSADQLAELRVRQAWLEERYGDSGPYSDYQWGMVNGKFSALRWVLGCEWDFLDT